MMEELCEQELIELGAKNTKVAYRGIYFEADLPTIYRINYTSRTISRVLAPLKSFHCRDANAIMKTGKKIEWDKLFSLDNTFAITSNVIKKFNY
ncbi:MAG: THUMP domain-containing protein [Ignavibacteriales bacterium]|nr:THUMP domain-containing protein [Ignavibacteriales bacterium]